MGTSAVVGYKTKTGETKNVSIHGGGYASHVIIELRERLAEEGFDALTKWVDNGGGKGYADVTANTPEEGKATGFTNLWDTLYGYEFDENGVYLRNADSYTGAEIKNINRALTPVTSGNYNKDNDLANFKEAMHTIKMRRLAAAELDAMIKF